MTADAALRAEFERWLSDVHLFPPPPFDNARNCYFDYPIHLAWQAWRESNRRGRQVGPCKVPMADG